MPNALSTVTSGVIQRDPHVMPALPSLFRWKLAVQELPSAPGLSWTATVECSYNATVGRGMFVCYADFANGTLAISLWRYDLGQFFSVREDFVDGIANVTCDHAPLTGSVFPATVLTNLTYDGNALIMGNNVAVFNGALPWFGQSTWYAAEDFTQVIQRVIYGNVIADTLNFDMNPDFLPSVFDDPITYCKTGTTSRAKVASV